MLESSYHAGLSYLLQRMKVVLESFQLQAYLQSEDFRMMVDSMKRRERERIMREVNRAASPCFCAPCSLYFCVALDKRF